MEEDAHLLHRICFSETSTPRVSVYSIIGCIREGLSLEENQCNVFNNS